MKQDCLICDIDGTLCDTVIRLLATYDCIVFFVTGRPELMRGLTMKHLEGIFKKNDQLVMKSNTDIRQHWKFKKEVLHEIKKEYNILFAIDDRNSIIKMYQKDGINCLRVVFSENGNLYKPNQRH